MAGNKETDVPNGEVQRRQLGLLCEVLCVHANKGMVAGNIKLLEANTTCHEILSGGREPRCKITGEFYARIFGGKHN